MGLTSHGDVQSGDRGMPSPPPTHGPEQNRTLLLHQLGHLSQIVVAPQWLRSSRARGVGATTAAAVRLNMMDVLLPWSLLCIVTWHCIAY